MESYGQSTMSQMRRCFFSFISDELLGCTHPHDWSKFIKLMVKPFYILHYRCANVVPSHLEKLVFWQKSITWNCFARPKKHQKEIKEILSNCGFSSNWILPYFPLFVCSFVTGVTSHISHIYKGINAMLIITGPINPYIFWFKIILAIFLAKTRPDKTFFSALTNLTIDFDFK